jgi:uncharacterized protein
MSVPIPALERQMSNFNQPKANSISGLMASLQAEAGLEKPRSLPPVHLWNPEHCGDIGLAIRRDGVWMQDGVRFTREKLVRLFSTVLRKDPDGFYLVTPHEKVVIQVEDAPFIGVRIDFTHVEGEAAILVTTNVGDVTLIDAEHPLRIVNDPKTGEPSVYVMVRRGLEARLARPPWYELVAVAEQDPATGCMLVRSSGQVFSLGVAG